MLGLKISLTGLIFVFLASLCVRVIGKKAPRLPITILLVAAFFGGVAAVIVGALIALWA